MTETTTNTPLANKVAVVTGASRGIGRARLFRAVSISTSWVKKCVISMP